MDICVIIDYQVDYECNYTYINEDRDFVSRNLKDSFTIDGGKLMDLIVSRINDSDFFEIESGEGYVRIGCFDPGSGETSDYIYKYKEASSGVHKQYD